MSNIRKTTLKMNKFLKRKITSNYIISHSRKFQDQICHIKLLNHIILQAVYKLEIVQDTRHDAKMEDG